MEKDGIGDEKGQERQGEKREGMGRAEGKGSKKKERG